MVDLTANRQELRRNEPVKLASVQHLLLTGKNHSQIAESKRICDEDLKQMGGIDSSSTEVLCRLHTCSLFRLMSPPFFL